MSDRLTTDYVGGEAKQRRFHDTLVDGALELCDLTKALNVTNDLALETARSQLEQLLVGVNTNRLTQERGYPSRRQEKRRCHPRQVQLLKGTA